MGWAGVQGIDGYGPAAGAASIRQAWDAIAAGIPVADYAATKPELAAALAAFGKR